MKETKKLETEHMTAIREHYLDGESYDQIGNFMKDKYGLAIDKDTIRWHAVRKFKSKNRNERKSLTAPAATKSSTGDNKVLILSDLHIPYVRNDILEIINNNRDAKTIIFNGDIVDCGEISVFSNLKTTSLSDEMVCAHKFLSEINNLVPNTKKILINGNHEERWMKYMSKAGDVLPTLHSSNILKEIVSGFTVYDHKKNLKIQCSPLENYQVIDKWYYQIGDLIVCHPVSFSKIECRTAVNAADYFSKLGFNFSTVVVGHTHRQGMVMRNGILAVEQGCLCEQMNYTDKGNLLFSPWNNGYYIAFFGDDEKIDKNKSKLHIL